MQSASGIDIEAFRKKTTPHPDIEAALHHLESHTETFGKLGHAELADLLAACRKTLFKVARLWVETSCEAKGLSMDSARAGEEWLNGPYVTLRYMRLLERTHRNLAKSGKPGLPGGPPVKKSGRTALQVFPTDTVDKLFFMGSRAEVWLKSGISANDLDDQIATVFRDDDHRPTVSLVLGGGNVSSIGPMDFLHKLFFERKLAILKMHPVNAYTGPFIEQGFAPLIEQGFLAVVYGDAEEGKFLCHHDQVADIHITGSDRTHDAIVFGENAVALKAAKQPQLKKPITSELGNVSPLIVVPGQWKDADLARQADNIVSSLVNNGGFNCNATRVIITWRGWPQREAFLDALRHRLAQTATRPGYYPGAGNRWATFKGAHPDAETFGQENDDGDLPWMFIPGLDPGNESELAFRMEAFCGVFGETALPAEDTVDFLRKATIFANDRLWGTLNATILIDPATEKNTRVKNALDESLRDLRFGTVSINHWAGVGYALGSTSWGAYPGHTIYDIVSGMDTVHNAYLISGIEKSVIYGPFRPWPKPPWFSTHRHSHLAGERLTAFEAAPSVLKMPGIFAAAMRD